MAPDALAERLVEWGYHRVPLVQDPGDLALRGGILDVFPAGYSRPLRLEFIGDDVERMREFDPESQRSLDRVEEALLLPVQELGRSRLAQPAARLVDERAAEIGLARQERRELVEAVRSGLAVPGIEFLLPYLYDDLATLADYLPAGTRLLDAGRRCDRRRRRDRLDAGDEPRRGGAARGALLSAARAPLSRAGAWRAALAGRPRVEVESLEELAGDGPRATTYSMDGLALRAGARVRRPADAGRRAARRSGSGSGSGSSWWLRARRIAIACSRSPRGARHRGARRAAPRSRRRSTPLASARSDSSAS